MIWAIICVVVMIAIGITVIICSFQDKEPMICIAGIIFLIVGILGFFDTNNFSSDNSSDASHLPAEPLAHNQTQTVFTTDEGTYIVNGLYPDGTYLLTVNGNEVLVVWQAVEGGVG